MKNLLSLIAIAAALFAPSVFAEGMYMEGGLTGLTHRSDGWSSASGQNARLVIGTSLHKNFGVEGMNSINLSSGTLSETIGSYRLSVDSKTSGYGFFLKPKFQATPELELFGRIGHMWGTTEVSNGRVTYNNVTVRVPGSVSASSDSSAYGLGANFSFSKKVYGQVDYMVYSDNRSAKLDGLTASVGFRF
jgi:hypothetical protein